jgi:hypothetical protein
MALQWPWKLEISIWELADDLEYKLAEIAEARHAASAIHPLVDLQLDDSALRSNIYLSWLRANNPLLPTRISTEPYFSSYLLVYCSTSLW